MDKENQEPSSSTALTQEMAKVEVGQKWTNPENEEQMDVDVEHKTFSIHDLPPQVLAKVWMKIFKMMDIKTLLICRQVNRKWNEMVVQVLQSRSDLEIQIDCCEYKKGKKDTKKGTKSKLKLKPSLADYLECFGHGHGRDDREIFPYTQFLCFVKTSTFDDKDWLKFLTDFGSSIKRLKLIIQFDNQGETMVELRVKLRNLLVNQLPKLPEFGIQLREWLAHSNKDTLLNIQALQKHEQPFQLAHLKVFYLDQSCFLKYTGLTTDLLEAAVNLQEIRSFDSTHFSTPIENIQLLRFLGKLGCLKDVEMELTLDFLSSDKENNTTESLNPVLALAHEFQLNGLDLQMWEIYRNKNNWEDASLFLTTLFESNQDSLKEMRIGSLGFLYCLRLPQFNKLTSLAIRNQFLEPILPTGIEIPNVFPALRSLELLIPWTTAFSSGDSIFAMPTLESLSVIGDSMDENAIAEIGFMCPNLKNFEIIKHSGKAVQQFPEVGTAIWTYLTKLQSLQMKIQVGNSANTFPAIDSCITGFPGETCIPLYDDIAAAAKAGCECDVPQADVDAERKNPSILNLKDLTSLKIYLVYYKKQSDCADESEDEESSRPELAENALTFLSEDFAFKLMDNLSYAIEKQTQYI